MSPTTTPQPAETELTPELIERVLKLSHKSLGRLVEIALDHLGPSPNENLEEVKTAWRDEIARRVTSIVDGTAVLVDGKESLARMRKRLAEKYGV
ncbi:MAG: hypothetical protein K8U57_10325 [Planctomycetes bacterium]|nr:hypothetical protein [Planctomycetota bacterium]